MYLLGVISRVGVSIPRIVQCNVNEIQASRASRSFVMSMATAAPSLVGISSKHFISWLQRRAQSFVCAVFRHASATAGGNQFNRSLRAERKLAGDRSSKEITVEQPTAASRSTSPEKVLCRSLPRPRPAWGTGRGTGLACGASALEAHRANHL